MHRVERKNTKKINSEHSTGLGEQHELCKLPAYDEEGCAEGYG